VLRTKLLRLGAAVAASAFLGSCKPPDRAEEPPAPDGPPFEAIPPKIYVAKAKNLLVGLAPTQAEIQAVEADPAALGGLVDEWMKLPQYERKMMRFFQLAFQQTQITSNDFLGQVKAQVGLNDSTTPRLLENIQQSFARTMVELSRQGRSLTEAMTTSELMMTTVMKEFYAYLDTEDINNEDGSYDHFRAEHRTLGIVVEAAQGPIPISETLDPASPNYMHWYNPDVAGYGLEFPGCHQDPIILGPVALTVHYLLLGTIDSRKLSNGFLCPRFPGSSKAAQFAPSDFEDWTMVTLRQPTSGESTTTFYDLPALRTAKELVLKVPRVGFFSTPAFFANWPTNVSNQMRATTQQALIVATGTPIETTDPTNPPGTPGLDRAHAASSGDCYGCHKTLDPTRSILAATWSWAYRRQDDPAFMMEPGVFAFRNVVQPVSSIAEFGAALANHPLVASGWTQKLCYYMNSAPCDETDPEFSRIAGLFASSGYSWTTLVKALATSPLTTNAADTATWRVNGEIVTVSRRDHLCAALDARLGFIDACRLGPTPTATNMPLIVSGLPSDSYGRGATAPILPNEPTLFFRAGLENICESIAAEVIDPPPESRGPGTKQWSSTDPDTAIADFVSDVMALTPADSRAGPATALLKSHFASALAQPGITPAQALQSTFVAACLAPSAVSIGL
jgi:hypothetical protein